ncbi:hypothetical protein DMN91_000527 [Ooceraea biroi]|uniref:protein-tyrosine-phosphatase n=1 Tax=Ooceraea biroi TaxID=2015173 RepID=A0A3L8E1X3_OOCBI|nr:hypothetical protein DMN91_000527 [Ooceraea biroi]
MLHTDIPLSHNIENYEHERHSVISNSEQSLSTLSDRQSRVTSYHHYEEIKEITWIVKVKDFDTFVKQAIETGLLNQQCEKLPKRHTQSCVYGKLPQNIIKNRCENLVPNDDTRVVLKQLPSDPHSDYINANYITTKCEQYWPDIGNKKKYGNIIVLNAKQHVTADYCFRTFQITYGRETRKVEHLHYTAWPDRGVPWYTHSIVTYLKKLLATPPGNGSVIVHCSTGVGRTGVIILCDICLRQAAAEGVVDIFAKTVSIKSERANIIHSKQQYLLAHLVLMECLLSMPTTLPCNKMLSKQIQELKKQLPEQQQRLQNTAWQDEALQPIPLAPPLSECNRKKNRFPELISDKISRIYLTRYPASDEDSDYLSAVYVDGVKLQKQYLATQLPMPSTISDFWRMVAEFKVELILMLQLPDPQDLTCCGIAPASGEFKPTPYLNITVKEIVELKYHTSQKLLLVDNSEKPSRDRSVTILRLTEWEPGRNQPPPSVITMVMFWQAAERIARGDGPTVTICHDGVTGCGLYLALSFLLERMAVEKEFDVYSAVRAVRRSRPDFVESLEHLEYLYNAAVAYLEHFKPYANFS